MKKHVKLYNRVFEALHKEDKFVLASDKTHEEIVDVITAAIDRNLESHCTRDMAECVLTALLGMDGSN